VPRAVVTSGRIELTAPTQRAARQKLADLKRALDEGKLDEGARLTLAEFLATWLAEAVRPTRKLATAARYACAVREQLVPRLGHHRLGDLTAHHVQLALNDLHAAGQAPATVRLARAVLRAALADAVRWEYLPRNVAALVRGPRARRPEVAPLTVDQARRLLAAVRDHRHYAVYAVALAVGLRRGEVVGLRWQDVDLAGGHLAVRRTIDRIEGRLRVDEPKSAAGRRTITLPARRVAALERHRARQSEERRLAGDRWREHGLVFPSTIGTPLEPRNLLRHCQATCDRLGLPRATFRQLRHTAASFLLAQGVPLKVVQTILGHGQIGLTADTYTHVLPELQADAAARQDALLGRLEATASDASATDKVENRVERRSRGRKTRPAGGATSPSRREESAVGPAGFEPATSEL
jgi:integrase